MGLIGAQFSEFLKVSFFRTTTHQRYEDSYHQQILMLIILLVSSLFSLVPFVSWGGNIGGLLHGFCAGMLLLSSNIKYYHEKKTFFCYGLLLAIILVVIAIFVVFERRAPDYLADTCQLYGDVHYENYDCYCGF
jgi:asparagine N-glycosylation enzyme membrane subunit Stt3